MFREERLIVPTDQLKKTSPERVETDLGAEGYSIDE
jgi:hypothetical protein